jgi:hypothetical protein
MEIQLSGVPSGEARAGSISTSKSRVMFEWC